MIGLRPESEEVRDIGSRLNRHLLHLARQRISQHQAGCGGMAGNGVFGYHDHRIGRCRPLLRQQGEATRRERRK